MKQNAGAQVLEAQGLIKDAEYLLENYIPVFDPEDDWSLFNYLSLKIFLKELHNRKSTNKSDK